MRRPSSRGEESAGVQIEPSVCSQLADLERRANFEGELLPGDEIGVMVECGHDDLVAGGEIWRPHDVATRFSASVVPLVKIKAVRVGDPNELRDPRPHRRSVGRLNRERIGSAMRICVARLVEIAIASRTTLGFCEVAAESR